MINEQRKEFIENFYYEKLDFCGCGSPCDTLYTIKEFLNTRKKREDRFELEDYNSRSCHYYNLYIKEVKEALNLKEDNFEKNDFSINEGIEQMILNVLNNCGVLEHGSSIGGSWLTDYGRELLEHLNSLNNEELEDILH